MKHYEIQYCDPPNFRWHTHRFFNNISSIREAKEWLNWLNNVCIKGTGRKRRIVKVIKTVV